MLFNIVVKMSHRYFVVCVGNVELLIKNIFNSASLNIEVKQGHFNLPCLMHVPVGVETADCQVEAQGCSQ